MRRTFRSLPATAPARRLMPLAALAGALVLLTAGGAAAARTTSGAGKKKAAVTVGLRASSLRQKILVDARGRTLYLFTHDLHAKSTCYGACAKVWPPLLVAGSSRAVGGASSKLLGRTRRSDGRYQVTYGGHPLYLFAKDAKAGQLTGQGISHFGGSWFVVSSAGSPIKAKPATATAVAPRKAAITISTRSVKGLGPILVDSKGLTLYMFVPDKAKKVTCVSACAALWPPVLLPKGDKVATSVAVSGKAEASLLGVAPDPTGGQVLTYKGWPLYTYVADTKPGMTTGQALFLNGGLWYVLSPTGQVLHKKVQIST